MFCNDFFFFFFKQKTAYEMRISDWSSDVCSSDLTASSTSGRRSSSPPWPTCAEGRSLELWRLRRNASRLRRVRRPPDPDHEVLTLGHCCDAQLGRASCRERVCQYG